MSGKFGINILLVLMGIVLMVHNAMTFPSSIVMKFEEGSQEDETSSALANVQKLMHELSMSLGDVSTVASCDACKVIVGAIKAIVDSNMTTDEAVMYAAGLCTTLGILPEEVCYYVMQNYVPEIVYSYAAIEVNVTVSNFCGFMQGGVCVVESEFLPIFDWDVTFPSPEPPYVPPPQPNPTSPTIRILHISDTHYDEQYLEGEITNCNEPMCCRANKQVNPTHEPVYAGKYGSNNATCDIPKITFESMLAFATTLQVDWIYWTGDIPPHDVWNQTKEGNIAMLLSTTALVKNYFPNDYTVFPACGNHEAAPCNSFPVPVVYPDYPIDYLYTQLDSVWTNFIPAIDHSTVLKGGYYAYDVRPDLRLLSINTNYGSDGNWWLAVGSNDPTEELQWMIAQLDDAEQKNMKVHMFGHHPPGSTVYVWSRNYRDILDRYKNTIAGHFYGHTHDDEFRLIYNNVDPTLPISVGQVAPSVTTYSYLNPAFRVYTVDGDYPGTTWQVLDYEEYWLDVDKANADGFPTWELLYKAKEAYGLADMTPVSYNDFINRMQTDDALFQTFYQHYSRVATGDPCIANCKQDMLCQLKRSWAGYSDADCGLQGPLEILKLVK